MQAITMDRNALQALAAKLAKDIKTEANLKKPRRILRGIPKCKLIYNKSPAAAVPPTALPHQTMTTSINNT
jgi:hypothetical protein